MIGLILNGTDFFNSCVRNKEAIRSNKSVGGALIASPSRDIVMCRLGDFIETPGSFHVCGNPPSTPPLTQFFFTYYHLEHQIVGRGKVGKSEKKKQW